VQLILLGGMLRHCSS